MMKHAKQLLVCPPDSFCHQVQADKHTVVEFEHQIQKIYDKSTSTIPIIQMFGYTENGKIKKLNENRIVLVVPKNYVPKKFQVLCSPSKLPQHNKNVIQWLFDISTGQWSWINVSTRDYFLYKHITEDQLYALVKIVNTNPDALFASSVWNHTHKMITSINMGTSLSSFLWKHIQHKMGTSNCYDCEEMYFKHIQNPPSVWNLITKGVREIFTVKELHQHIVQLCQRGKELMKQYYYNDHPYFSDDKVDSALQEPIDENNITLYEWLPYGYPLIDAHTYGVDDEDDDEDDINLGIMERRFNALHKYRGSRISVYQWCNSNERFEVLPTSRGKLFFIAGITKHLNKENNNYYYTITFQEQDRDLQKQLTHVSSQPNNNNSFQSTFGENDLISIKIKNMSVKDPIFSSNFLLHCAIPMTFDFTSKIVNRKQNTKTIRFHAKSMWTTTNKTNGSVFHQRAQCKINPFICNK